MHTDLTTTRNIPSRFTLGRFAPGRLALALLLGLSLSSVTLASSYDTGIFEFQQKLANNGNPQAQYQLATMYESGRGVEKNINLAKQWYEKSAAKDFSAAKHRLTYLEIKTGGFKETHKPWVNQLASEAKRGDGEAMFILGDMYENGIGVKKSLKRAEGYYKSSAAKGNVDAENRLFNIEQQVSSQQAQQQKNSEQEKARQEAAQKQKAEQERKARAAREKAARDRARAEQGKKAQQQAEAERRKLEAERKRLAEERRKLEAQKQALQAQKAKENAAKEAEQKKAEDDKFEAELCTGKAARFRTQCN